MGFIINPYLVQPSVPAFTGLLDTYSGAAAAYSAARRLSSTYTGALIRVRRSSDNTEQDIGYDSNNVLDETALTTFVGAGNGFVTTWYDQSGNGKDATQSTASNQPQIVTSGVIDTLSGKPSLKQTGYQGFSLLNSLNQSNPVTSFNTLMFVNEPNTSLVNTNGPFGGNIVVADGYWMRVVSYDLQSKAYMTYIGGGGTYTGAPSIKNLFYINTTGNRVYMSFNGGSVNNLNSWNASNNQVYHIGNVWDPASGSGFKGKYNELILWSSEQSANESGIKSNINTYYSIY